MPKDNYNVGWCTFAVARRNLNTKVSPQSKMATPMVSVPLERLRALEALEASLPDLLAKAKAEAHAERFAILRARDAADPEAHKRRTNESRAKNREELNARRREAYKAKKEAATAGAGAPPTA